MIYEIAIIGAGPAGLAAARECTAYDVPVVVIDEQNRAGGQIYRQAPPALAQGAMNFGTHYLRGTAHANQTTDLPGIDWRLGHAVWNIELSDDFRILTTAADGLAEVRARRLIVATGCHDLGMPFPGWTLPGVMGAGALQAMMKSQRVLPGDRMVLVGSHPLMLIVADQMRAFRHPPAEVIFSQKPAAALGLLRQPLTALRFAPTLVQAAMALLRLWRSGVAVRFGQAVIGAEGDEVLARVHLAPLDANGLPRREMARTVECDTLGIGYGFAAQAEIPRMLRADASWSNSGCWIVDHDEGMRSTVPNLYVAGEVAGIGGAHTAAAEGKLAALTAMADGGRTVAAALIRRAARARARSRRFAALLARLAAPPARLPDALQTPDTVICRCEEITRAELQSALHKNAFVGTTDALKLLGRAGMGPCQARYCGPSVARITAQTTGRTLADVGPPRVRGPIKPVPLSQFRLPED